MFAQAAALDADETDIFCMALPMYHCFSLTAMALAAVAVGACLCFPPDRKGRTILRTIEKEALYGADRGADAVFRAPEAIPRGAV